jgi:hypothetical protein
MAADVEYLDKQAATAPGASRVADPVRQIPRVAKRIRFRAHAL